MWVKIRHVVARQVVGYPQRVLMLRRAAVVGTMLSVALAAALGVQEAAAAHISASPTAPSIDAIGGPDLSAAGIAVHYLARATPVPAINADSWLVADLTTGEVLAAKGAHLRALPASMLKTLTAVTLMPKLDKATVIKATTAEAKAEGGNVGIVPGATYSIWDLWHGFLLSSSNDAGAALADANGGEAATVAEMRAMAKHLQANDTVVKNESGLDAVGQVSSAYDMALIARAALALPDFRTVTKTISYDFPGKVAPAGAARPTYKIYSQNRLLIRGFTGTIGGKTGFTSLAHRTFWGAATRGTHTLVVVLMQVHDPTESAARNLLTWGFANIDRVRPIGVLVDPIVASAAPTPTTSPTAATSADDGANPDTQSKPASGDIQWLPLVGLAVVAAIAALWQRRRRTSAEGPDPSDAHPDSTSPATPEPGPLAPVEISHSYGNARPSGGAARLAAQRTSSVIISRPGRRPESAPHEPDPVPVDNSGPQPSHSATSPVADPGAQSEQREGPPRDSGGHVRVVTPPKG